MTKKLKEPVKILFHLNGGFTKVILERTIGVGPADGGIALDIPTEKIPGRLRKIGSRFILLRTENREEIKIEILPESLVRDDR